MKSTQIRKVKRSKTRRTRRKTRTIHTGGVNWKFWKTDNAVAPVPSITLEQVKQYLLDNNYHTTLASLNRESIHIDKQTPNSKTKNGWYTELRSGFGADLGCKELLNDGLPTKDGYLAINIFDDTPDGADYVANIDKLPDPSKEYKSNKNTYILRNTRSLKLVWKKINSSDQSAQSAQSDQFVFDINNPLQITIDGKSETLKPV